MHSADVELCRVVWLTGFLGDRAEQRSKAVLQLQCRFFRERGKEDFVRRNAVSRDEVNGAPQENACLPRTRPRWQKQRALGVQNGGYLFRVRVKSGLGPETPEQRRRGWRTGGHKTFLGNYSHSMFHSIRLPRSVESELLDQEFVAAAQFILGQIRYREIQ